jgi:hypothetical protein
MDSLILYNPPFPLVRIGSPDSDGGYMVCDLPGSYDVIVACGVSSNIDFEIDLCGRYPGLKCFAFDGTVESLPTPNEKVMFIKQNVGNGTNGTTNLKEYIGEHENVFLKMDIEGHEFRVFPELSDVLHRIKQIVVEIHSPGDIQLHPTYFKGLSDITHPVMFDTLSTINKTHTLVHVHPNNGCEVHTYEGVVLPNVFECTFVRNEFVTSKVKNVLALPMSFDVPNVRNKPIVSFTGYPFRNTGGSS